MSVETHIKTPVEMSTRIGTRPAVKQLGVIADLLGVPQDAVKVEKLDKAWPINQSVTAPVEVFNAHDLVGHALTNPGALASPKKWGALFSKNYYRKHATRVLTEAGKIPAKA